MAEGVKKRKKRILIVLGAVVVVLALVVFSVPYALSTGAGRGAIVGAVNKRIAGKLHVQDLSLSWTGPCEIKGLKVTDPNGRQVLDVARASYAGGLWQAIMSGEQFGQVVLESPRVDLYLDRAGQPSLAAAFQSPQPAAPTPSKPGELPKPVGRLLIRNGSAKVVQPDGRAYEITGLNAQWDLDTLNVIRGEVDLTATGGGRLSASAEISGLAATGRIDPQQAAGKFTVATAEAIALAPLVKFIGAGIGVSGSAKLDASGTFEGTTGKGQFALAASRLESAGGDKRQLRPIDLNLTGDLAATKDEITASARLTGEGAALRAEMSYRPGAAPSGVSVEAILAAALGGGSVTLPDFSLDANGLVDLPRLGEAVPGLLKVLPNVRITGGKLRAGKIAVRGGRRPSLQGDVSLTGLAGQKGSETLTCDPVTLSLDTSLAEGKGLQITRAAFESTFAHLTASGSQANLKLDFAADAAAIHKQIGELLDLSSLPRTGTAAGNLHLTSRDETRVGQALDATVKDVEYRSDGRLVRIGAGRVRQAGDLVFTTAKRTKLAEAILSEATVELDDQLVATAAGNYNFQKRALALDFDLKEAKLAGLVQRAAAWTKGPLPAVEGLVTCRGKVRQTSGGPLSIQIEGGRATQLRLLEPAAPGKPAPPPGKAIDLGFAANVQSDANTLAGDLDITGPAITLGGKFAYSSGEAPSIDGWQVLSALVSGGELNLPDASADLSGRVDLGAVAAAAPSLLKTAPDFRIDAGLVELRALALRTGKWPSVNADLAVTNAAATRAGKAIQWKPLAFVLQAERQPTGLFRVVKAQLVSDPANFALTGDPSRLSGTFSADLAAVREYVGALADLGQTTFAGALSGTLRVETSVKAPGDMAIVLSGQALLAGASVDGKPLDAKKIDLTWSGGRFATRPQQIALASLKLTSPMATVNVADFQADLSKAVRLTGKFDLAADVEPCLAAAAPLAGWKQTPKVAGRLTAAGDFRSTEGGFLSTGGGKLADLRVGAGKGQLRQQDVTLAYRGNVDNVKDSLALDQFDLKSQALTLRLAGKINRLGTERDLDLAGTYEGSWADLTALLHELDPSLKDTVSLAGTTGGKLTVTGPLQKPKVTPTFRGMAAATPVGWTTADLYGLALGEAKLQPQLRDGQIVLPETVIPASSGEVRLLGMVDLRDDPPVYHMTGQKMILRDVPITRTFSQELLSRFNPVFGNLASVEGQISLQLQDLTLPLGKTIAKTGSGGGHLDLQKLRIQPAGVLGTLLELGGLSGGEKVLVAVNGADFAIRQGRIHYSNFRMTFSKSFYLEFKGSVGFDDTVNLTVLVPVNAELLKKLGVRGPVLDFSRVLGGVQVPIPLLGTRSKPQMDLAKVDVKPLIERATKALIQEGAGKAIEDLLKGGKKDNKKPAGEATDPLGDLLDLFKKPQAPRRPQDPNAPRRN